MAHGLTFSLLGSVFLAMVAPSAQSLPARAFERAELFASCAGKLSAIATHQNGYGDGDVEATRALVDTFETLLEATLPDAYAQGVPENEPARWRSRGWSEMAALLSQAHFSFDNGQARASAEALQARVAACLSVILPTRDSLNVQVLQADTPTR